MCKDLKEARLFLHTSLREDKLNKFVKDVIALKSKKGWKWDRAARNVLFDYLNTEFKRQFKGADSKGHLFIGINPIPKLRKTFYGSGMYPDGAIVCSDGKALALEIDHGYKGSQVRNALSKAAFSVQIGGYSESHLLFLWEKPIPQTSNIEEKVLRWYKKEWKTFLHSIR